MAAYGRSYDELIRQPYSRFQDLWQSYSVRVGLEKLDEEVSRQRVALQSAWADPDSVQRALADLEERAAEARRIIMDPEATLDTQDQGPEPGVSSSGFRTDKWWQSPPGTEQQVAEEEGDIDEVGAQDTAEETPVRTARLEDLMPEGSVSGGLEIEVEIEED